MNNETISSIVIEIAYASEAKQKLYQLKVQPNCTVREAVINSCINQDFPEVDLHCAPIGIFGKKVPDETPLQHGQRIEIYRPLLADPKEARRKRVKKNTKN